MFVFVVSLVACGPVDGTDSGKTGDDYVPAAPPLVVNEFLAVSEAFYADPAGTDPTLPEYDNWIEIYNTGDEIVQYDGLYLTDNQDEPMKWALPAGQGVDAGGFDLFWADKQPEQGDHHVTFGLKGGGEFLGLFYVEDGYEPVQVDALEYGSQVVDVSQQRIPDGSLTWEPATPTPNAPNAAD